MDQRDPELRAIDIARKNVGYVMFVSEVHEHYDVVFDDW